MSQTRRLRGALFLALCVFGLWSLGWQQYAFDIFRQQILGNSVKLLDFQTPSMLKLSPQITRFKFRWDVFSRSSSWSDPFYLHDNPSGQIIATSHDLTPNGGLVREIPLFQGNLGWWNIIIWPDPYMKYLGVTSHCVCPPSPQELQCFHYLHQDGGGHRRISFHRSDIHRGLSFAFQCLGRWAVKYRGTCIETHPVNVTMIDWHTDWSIRARWQHTSKYIKMSHAATFLHPGFVGSSL